MIARINLLPWRQRRRDRQRRAFLVQLGIVFAGSACLVFLAALVLDGRIASQDARNEFLRSGLVELERQADAIYEVRRRTDETLERLQALADLRRGRTRTVRILEELARTVTPGVHYTSLVKRGTHITAHGVARSNHAVSALMRSLEASERFEAPRLKGIEEMRATEEADHAAVFELTFATSVPTAQDNGS
ncbi:MAG: PilN domain-containing protein [Gammaproteobacteria bacterium]|nr:PilN domain-containing protein [Gammaproteobacteria bacterium]